MRKYMMVAMTLLIAVSGIIYAQDAKEVRRQRKEVSKLAEAELNKKVSKEARKEARKLEKEGWRTFPGDLPMEKQLYRSYEMEVEYITKEDGSIVPRYLIGRGMTNGSNYSVAQNAAIELAKQYVAGLAEIDITILTETTIANVEAETVSSFVEVVSQSKSIVSKKIGEVMPVVTLRKETKDGVDVLVNVVCDRNTIIKMYKDAIRKQLELNGIKLTEDINKLLYF